SLPRRESLSWTDSTSTKAALLKPAPQTSAQLDAQRSGVQVVAQGGYLKGDPSPRLAIEDKSAVARDAVAEQRSGVGRDQDVDLPAPEGRSGRLSQVEAQGSRLGGGEPRARHDGEVDIGQWPGGAARVGAEEEDGGDPFTAEGSAKARNACRVEPGGLRATLQ